MTAPGLPRRALLALPALLGLVLSSPAKAKTGAASAPHPKGNAMTQTAATTAVKSGYAPVNGLQLYYEIHGQGDPLVLLHGGFGQGSMFAALLPALSAGRQVITVDLQGHGRTADIDRPFSFDAFSDDVAALIRHLGLKQADVMGYSLGGVTALRTAIRHPEVVRKLVVVSVPYARAGWYPEVTAGMDQIGAAMAEHMKASPMYQAYAAVAPRPQDFGVLADKTGALLRTDYDWSKEVAALPMPVMLVYADADSVPTSHVAAFYGLLGGGKKDAGWDGANMPRSRLAILPGHTHYDVFMAPGLAPAVGPFLLG